MEPITPQKHRLIVNSFKRVFESGEIEYLSKTAYNFIYLASGFIAHYNLGGFRDAYSDVSNLAAQIAQNFPANQWNNFHRGEQHYDYYMSKKAVYNDIAKLAEKYFD